VRTSVVRRPGEMPSAWTSSRRWSRSIGMDAVSSRTRASGVRTGRGVERTPEAADREETMQSGGDAWGRGTEWRRVWHTLGRDPSLGACIPRPGEQECAPGRWAADRSGSVSYQRRVAPGRWAADRSGSVSYQRRVARGGARSVARGVHSAPRGGGECPGAGRGGLFRERERCAQGGFGSGRDPSLGARIPCPGKQVCAPARGERGVVRGM
jgi:hypothetical protein